MGGWLILADRNPSAWLHIVGRNIVVGYTKRQSQPEEEFAMDRWRMILQPPLDRPQGYININFCSHREEEGEGAMPAVEPRHVGPGRR